MPGRQPRRLGATLAGVAGRLAPSTPLAAAQSAWPRAAGGRIAGEAAPVRERDGVLTIVCSSSTWAQELDLLSTQLLERLNEELASGDEAGVDQPPVKALRFTAR